MADGKFNRSILPHGQFQSGLAAGKSIMRMKAVQAFRGFLEEEHAGDPLPEEEVKRRVELFEQLLSK